VTAVLVVYQAIICLNITILQSRGLSILGNCYNEHEKKQIRSASPCNAGNISHRAGQQNKHKQSALGHDFHKEEAGRI
jgi:hypothetical protein